MIRPAARRGAWAVIAIFALSGCMAPANRSLPPPESTSSTPPESTTSEVDYSKVALAPVEGTITPPPPISTGRSTIRGVVTGPEGPLPGAVVRLERLVGDATQRRDVTTGPDGTYEAKAIPGGRYRVRAFLPPTLTTMETEVFYLVDGDERDLALVTVPFTGRVVLASTTPAAPTVGGGVNLAIRVAERQVDADGIGREQPLANVPVRVNSSGWTELVEPTGLTDAAGVLVLSFRCDRVSPVSAVAIVGVEQEAIPLDVPPCAPRPTTTTTTTTPATTTTGPDETTITTTTG